MVLARFALRAIGGMSKNMSKNPDMFSIITCLARSRSAAVTLPTYAVLDWPQKSANLSGVTMTCDAYEALGPLDLANLGERCHRCVHANIFTRHGRAASAIALPRILIAPSPGQQPLPSGTASRAFGKVPSTTWWCRGQALGLLAFISLVRPSRSASNALRACSAAFLLPALSIISSAQSRYCLAISASTSH